MLVPLSTAVCGACLLGSTMKPVRPCVSTLIIQPASRQHLCAAHRRRFTSAASFLPSSALRPHRASPLPSSLLSPSLCRSPLSPSSYTVGPLRVHLPLTRCYNRFATPSPTAPPTPPPVVFKPPRPSFDPLAPSSSPSAPIDYDADLRSYWPDGFVPNLINPLPWMVPSSPPPAISPVPFTRSSVRCAVLGRKVGMMAVWDVHGVRHPVTVVEVDSQVVRVNPTLSKGKVGLVLGIGRRKLKRVTKALMVQAKVAGVHPKERLTEFRVTPDAVLPVGHRMDVRHFVPGQWLDVCGVTSGKGFQGAMKRHGFGGQPASHGVSVSHRSLGSTGSIQDPGRVWKGKKMAGRMGGVRDTQLNLRLYKVEPTRNLLFIRGAVPGHAGAVVQVRDAIKKNWEKHVGRVPPFPTFTHSQAEEDTKAELLMDVGDQDPFAFGGS